MSTEPHDNADWQQPQAPARHSADDAGEVYLQQAAPPGPDPQNYQQPTADSVQQYYQQPPQQYHQQPLAQQYQQPTAEQHYLPQAESVPQYYQQPSAQHYHQQPPAEHYYQQPPAQQYYQQQPADAVAPQAPIAGPGQQGYPAAQHQGQPPPGGFSPPAGGYAPPPTGFPMPGVAPQPIQPKKSSKPLLILGGIVAGVFALCVGCGAMVNSADSSSSTSTSSGSISSGEGTKAKTVAMNTAARDGKFEFTVTDMDCSRTSVGGEYLNEKAQGKFCIISVTVKNIGDEAQMFSGSDQKAFDAKGTQYQNDGGAEIYANDHSETFLNDINPGNQVTGKVVFDVPQSTTLTQIELHDSMFSGGVKVSLR